MFGKKQDDVDRYATAKANGAKNWRKFKQTRKVKYLNKANFEYGKMEALDKKLSNPGTNIKSYELNNSFNSSITTNKTNSVSANIKFVKANTKSKSRKKK